MPKLKVQTIKARVNGNGNGLPTRAPTKLHLVTVPEKSDEPQKRTVKNGKPSNDLILSAYTEGNDTVFPQISP